MKNNNRERGDYLLPSNMTLENSNCTNFIAIYRLTVEVFHEITIFLSPWHGLFTVCRAKITQLTVPPPKISFNTEYRKIVHLLFLIVVNLKPCKMLIIEETGKYKHSLPQSGQAIYCLCNMGKHHPSTTRSMQCSYCHSRETSFL